MKMFCTFREHCLFFSGKCIFYCISCLETCLLQTFELEAKNERKKHFSSLLYSWVYGAYIVLLGASLENSFFFFTNKRNKPSLYSVWASVCIVRRFVFISSICPLLQFAATKQFSINYFIVLLLCNFNTSIKFLVTVPIPLSTKKEMRIEEMITK